MLKLLDCPRESIHRITLQDLFQKTQDGRRLQERLEAGQSVRNLDADMLRSDGTPYHARLTVSPFNVAGKHLTLVLAEDNTKEKQLEARLQRAEKMEAIGTLAGGVAHDLNNVLSAIVGYPELLLMELDPGSPMAASIQAIQQSGEKAAAIVQDLLTLARRGVTVTEVVNLNHIVKDYLGNPVFEKLRFFNPEAKVETRLAGDLLNVLGSPVHLTKTVMNLVSNSAEAMPAGGKITISTENRYVDQPFGGYDHVAEGEYATLTVADTGKGVSPEDMDRIFEPFFTKKVMGRSGTGLGMAVVWGTIKDHHGYIDLQSTEGLGTRITLYFPATRESPAEEKTPFSIDRYKGNNEVLLVVDDVPEQRQLARAMLTRLGYIVHTVGSGEEAVAFAEHNYVDLVVLDMIMDPGIDGLETYRRLRAVRTGLKAVIASGFSQTERIYEAQALHLFLFHQIYELAPNVACR